MKLQTTHRIVFIQPTSKQNHITTFCSCNESKQFWLSKWIAITKEWVVSRHCQTLFFYKTYIQNSHEKSSNFIMSNRQKCSQSKSTRSSYHFIPHRTWISKWSEIRLKTGHADMVVDSYELPVVIQTVMGHTVEVSSCGWIKAADSNHRQCM